MKNFDLTAKYLRDARRAKDLTQSEVANYLGLTSPQFVSNWERGLCGPSYDSFKVLCKLYELDPHEFFGVLLKQESAYLKEKLGI